MKNAIILHGTDATSQDNWFPWLKSSLEENGWQVWAPDLPGANRPNIKKYNEFITSQESFRPDSETVMIGHSSGAVAVLGLLQSLPDEIIVERAILVGAFSNDLGWNKLSELFDPQLDYKKIKKQVKEIIFIHSDNDPYIPLEQPEKMADALGAELIVLKGQKHFSASMDPKYTKFPYLLEVITQENE